MLIEILDSIQNGATELRAILHLTLMNEFREFVGMNNVPTHFSNIIFLDHYIGCWPCPFRVKITKVTTPKTNRISRVPIIIILEKFLWGLVGSQKKILESLRMHYLDIV